jgi:GcrA cell cycle regulator
MEWNDTIITELRGLWAEGLSTAEIGRRLGISKNAVVGKAHRLDLSPLPMRPAPMPMPATVAAAPVSKPAPSRRLAAVSTPATRVSACCWPIGEPGKPSFHFCDAVAVQGKPYCTEHAQLAYVKIRDRREDAA